MVLKLTEKSIIVFIMISAIFNCNQQKEHTVRDVQIIMSRNIPVPDDIIYYLEPNQKLINKESISFIEILDEKGDQIEKSYSFKSPNNVNAIKFRTTRFIGEFQDSLSLKKFLLQGKFKVVFKNGQEIIYD